MLRFVDFVILQFAPLAPQLWGEPYPQSPPELGDLGGEKDLCVHRILERRLRRIKRFDKKLSDPY
jgi:hypothetical protein